MTKEGKRLARFYRYVLVSDDGVAPCVDNNLLTLATCKPVIRRTARVGDWVAGYMPKAQGSELLVWMAQIGEKLNHFEYEEKFRGRRDAAYRLNGHGEPERVYPDYHTDEKDKKKDLSADVLIFDPTATWYFGSEPKQPPAKLAGLKPAGQGHRVNFRIESDLQQFLEWLSSIGPSGFYAKPLQAEQDSCFTTCTPRKQKLKSRC